MLCSVVLCSVVLCSDVLFSVVLCSVVLCSVVLFSVVLCSVVLCREGCNPTRLKRTIWAEPCAGVFGRPDCVLQCVTLPGSHYGFKGPAGPALRQKWPTIKQPPSGLEWNPSKLLG